MARTKRLGRSRASKPSQGVPSSLFKVPPAFSKGVYWKKSPPEHTLPAEKMTMGRHHDHTNLGPPVHYRNVRRKPTKTTYKSERFIYDVIVSNLPFGTVSQDLGLFNKYGTVEKLRWHAGQAILTYKYFVEAEAALKANGKKVWGHEIVVELLPESDMYNLW